jgi:hypothetical protein
MVTGGCFIDWLSMAQVHRPGSIALLGSEFVVSTSLETGEVVSERVKGFEHEGSFDTRLHVCCDGTSVSIKGNPSAFDRPDNVFGVRTIPEAVTVYNRVLDMLGLPLFDNTRPHEEMKSGSTVIFRPYSEGPNRKGMVGYFGGFDGRQSAHLDKLLNDGRPRISRVDLTENLFSENARDFLRQMSGYVHHGKAGFLYPNGSTVEWGGKKQGDKGSRRVYHKYYDKGAELDKKISEFKRRSRFDPDREKVEARLAYLVKVRDWCVENGVVRNEVSLKSTELIDRGLIYIESWSDEVMANILYPYQFHKKIKLEETRFEGIMDALMARGVSARIARQAELLHRSWINGDDIHKLSGTKSSFYRYRTLLLGFGVDIATPCDISRIAMRVNRCSYREAVPPAWYLMPGQESIKSAA